MCAVAPPCKCVPSLHLGNPIPLPIPLHPTTHASNPTPPPSIPPQTLSLSPSTGPVPALTGPASHPGLLLCLHTKPLPTLVMLPHHASIHPWALSANPTRVACPATCYPLLLWLVLTPQMPCYSCPSPLLSGTTPLVCLPPKLVHSWLYTLGHHAFHLCHPLSVKSALCGFGGWGTLHHTPHTHASAPLCL